MAPPVLAKSLLLSPLKNSTTVFLNALFVSITLNNTLRAGVGGEGEAGEGGETSLAVPRALDVQVLLPAPCPPLPPSTLEKSEAGDSTWGEGGSEFSERKGVRMKPTTLLATAYAPRKGCSARLSREDAGAARLSSARLTAYYEVSCFTFGWVV